MKKKFLALLLAVTMVVSLAACGGTSDSAKDDSKATTAEDGGTSDTDAANNGSAAVQTWDEHYKITWAYIGSGQGDTEKIAAAISEILEPIYNVSIELLPMGWGEFSDQLTLMLSGSEKLDLVPVLTGLGSTYIGNGFLVNLNDYIDQYGDIIKEELGEDNAKVCNVNGFIYGIPTYKEWCKNVGVAFREDILTEAGFSVDDVKTLDDLDAIYEVVSEMYPNMTMLAGRQGGTPGQDLAYNDGMGNSYGVIMPDDEEGIVINYFETEEFKYNMQKMYEYAQKGWISKDCATIQDRREDQMKAGNVFSYITPVKPDKNEEDSLESGYNVVSATITDTFRETGAMTFIGWGIGRNCEDPERVFQVLNYMYGSSEIMNLLNWGIEGEHYVFLDEEAGIIGFPEGQNVSNTKYNLNIGYEIQNQKIAYIWDGRPADLWEKYEEYNATDPIISTGFIFDNSEVTTELAALSNVFTQYMDALGSGSVDPNVVIDEFNAALYKAGLQTVMDAKQEQLNVFLGK